jgi:hypothetical protein
MSIIRRLPTKKDIFNENITTLENLEKCMKDYMSRYHFNNEFIRLLQLYNGYVVGNFFY